LAVRLPPARPDLEGRLAPRHLAKGLAQEVIWRAASAPRAGDFCLVKSRQNRPPGARAAEAAASLCASFAAEFRTRHFGATHPAPRLSPGHTSMYARSKLRFGAPVPRAEARHPWLRPLRGFPCSVQCSARATGVREEPGRSRWSSCRTPRGRRVPERTRSARRDAGRRPSPREGPGMARERGSAVREERRAPRSGGRRGRPFFSPLFFGRAKKRGPVRVERALQISNPSAGVGEPDTANAVLHGGAETAL